MTEYDYSERLKTAYRADALERLIGAGVPSGLASKWADQLTDEADRIAGKRPLARIFQAEPTIPIGDGISERIVLRFDAI